MGQCARRVRIPCGAVIPCGAAIALVSYARRTQAGVIVALINTHRTNKPLAHVLTVSAAAQCSGAGARAHTSPSVCPNIHTEEDHTKPRNPHTHTRTHTRAQARRHAHACMHAHAHTYKLTHTHSLTHSHARTCARSPSLAGQRGRRHHLQPLYCVGVAAAGADDKGPSHRHAPAEMKHLRDYTTLVGLPCPFLGRSERHVYNTAAASGAVRCVAAQHSRRPSTLRLRSSRKGRGSAGAAVGQPLPCLSPSGLGRRAETGLTPSTSASGLSAPSCCVRTCVRACACA